MRCWGILTRCGVKSSSCVVPSPPTPRPTHAHRQTDRQTDMHTSHPFGSDPARSRSAGAGTARLGALRGARGSALRLGNSAISRPRPDAAPRDWE